MNRLYAAMMGYAALAALEWFTLSSEKVRLLNGAVEGSLRSMALAVLLALALLTALHYWKETRPARLESAEDEEK